MVTAAKGAEKPECVVAPGRTVSVNGKAVGPGEPVHGLSAADLSHLITAGFVAKPVDESVGLGVKVGGLQIKGGRKPGAAIA